MTDLSKIATDDLIDRNNALDEKYTKLEAEVTAAEEAGDQDAIDAAARKLDEVATQMCDIQDELDNRW